MRHDGLVKSVGLVDVVSCVSGATAKTGHLGPADIPQPMDMTT